MEGWTGWVTCRTADRVGRRGWTSAVGKLLSRSRAKLWRVSLASLLLLLVPLSHAELSSALKVVPPGSYTILLMLLTPESGLHGWLLESLLWPLLSVSMLRELLLSSCAVLPAVLLLGLLWLFCRACACGFVVASASLISRLETLAFSCVRWLFCLASV